MLFNAGLDLQSCANAASIACDLIYCFSSVVIDKNTAIVVWSASPAGNSIFRYLVVLLVIMLVIENCSLQFLKALKVTVQTVEFFGGKVVVS